MKIFSSNLDYLFPVKKGINTSITINPFSNKFLDSSRLHEFADNIFNFDENGKHFSKRVGNAVGKGEIAHNCSLHAISSFPTVFSKDLYSRHIKTRDCLRKD